MTENYTDVEFYSNTLNGFGLEEFTTATLPVSGSNGQMVFNTDTSKVMYWNGLGWGNVGGSVYGSLATFSAWNAPQTNLNNGGQQTVVFHDEHLNTIGASMTNSIITLPTGAYYVSFSFIITPGINNSQLSVGLKINGSTIGVKSTLYDRTKNKNYTRALSHIIQLATTGTLELYAEREGDSGTIITVNNSGTLDILKVS